MTQSNHILAIQQQLQTVSTISAGIDYYETMLRSCEGDIEAQAKWNELLQTEKKRLEEVKQIAESLGKGFLDDLVAFVESFGGEVIKLIIKNIFGELLKQIEGKTK